MSYEATSISLMSFSPGGGCGCKIPPDHLHQLVSKLGKETRPELIVGISTKDDAAVYELPSGEWGVATCDFFTPITNDPFDFGRIAAANSISDVYAMGGKPLFALSILGWPTDDIPLEEASRVLVGAQKTCEIAQIAIVGGHSINIKNPIFGLSVFGVVAHKSLKRNSTATSTCQILISKPLGTGVLSTAEKNGKLPQAYRQTLVENMAKLNVLGYQIAHIEGIKAMTDITGFGLGGHLLEMAEGAGLDAEINFESLPILNGFSELVASFSTGGGLRNRRSFERQVINLNEKTHDEIIYDPQTNGGLLIAVEQAALAEVTELAQLHNHHLIEIGRFKTRTGNQSKVSVY